MDPLLAAIRREVGAIIAKLHKQDFSDSVDPMTAMGGGASPYMKELAEKLAFIKAEVLSQFNTPEVSRGWSVDLLQLLTMSNIHTFCQGDIYCPVRDQNVRAPRLYCEAVGRNRKVTADE